MDYNGGGFKPEYKSPIIMERVMRAVDGDPEKSMHDMVEIRRADDEALLATCMMGDEIGVERISDRLSAMRLPREAMRLRAMHQEARRPWRAKA